MPLNDLFDGCYSEEHQKLGTPEKFEETFCRRCRNAECRRSAIGESRWVQRISTQEERLLIHPRFEDPEDPRFKDVVDKKFLDKLQEAMALEVSSRRGDWEIPPPDVVEMAVKAMQTPDPTHFEAPQDKAGVVWEGTVKGSLGRMYTIKLTREEGGTETWTCTCPAFTHGTVGPLGCKHIIEARGLYAEQTAPPVENPPQPRMPVRTGAPKVLSVPQAGNTRFPSEGMMIDGTPTSPTPSVQPPSDPWASPNPPVARGTVVPVHGKIVMGGGGIKKP